jgi:hypothetical protein
LPVKSPELINLEIALSKASSITLAEFFSCGPDGRMRESQLTFNKFVEDVLNSMLTPLFLRGYYASANDNSLFQHTQELKVYCRDYFSIFKP